MVRTEYVQEVGSSLLGQGLLELDPWGKKAAVAGESPRWYGHRDVAER